MLNKTNILLTITLLILLVINLVLFNNKIIIPTSHNNAIKKQYEEYVSQQQAQKQAEEDALKLDENGLQANEMSKEEMAAEKLIDLKSMGEADRMITYCNDFLSLIESQQYEEAYNILYDDFKKNYFPTLDSFTEYVKNLYPTFIQTEFTNIERQGDYYILYVKVKDYVYNKKKTVAQRFVIHENNFNDFEISFQII